MVCVETPIGDGRGSRIFTPQFGGGYRRSDKETTMAEFGLFLS